MSKRERPHREFNSQPEPQKECPNFPFFGADYPDATCIDGKLYDLDSPEGGKVPCPFCKPGPFTTWYIKQAAGRTAAEAQQFIQQLNDQYNDDTKP